MKSDLPAKNIYSAVWPLHLISRIFGLAPYSLKRDKVSVKDISTTNCFCQMWSIFWIILLVALVYIITTANVIENTTLKEKLLEVPVSTSMYTYSIISLLLPLTINREKVPQIISKLSEIDNLFSDKKYRSQIYQNTRLFIIVQISVMALTLLLTYLLTELRSS
jgi:hypothetical protein